MTRYDNFHVIDNAVDREKVGDAIARLLHYCTDVAINVTGKYSITVEDGNIFFYSPVTDTHRFFVEVKPATNQVKITLAGSG